MEEKLTNFISTEHSPPSEANRYRLASQEIPPPFLWNPKVYYHNHKSSPHASVLAQINLVHASPFHLLKMHFNIIFPSTPCLLSVWRKHNSEILIPVHEMMHRL